MHMSSVGDIKHSMKKLRNCKSSMALLVKLYNKLHGYTFERIRMKLILINIRNLKNKTNPGG